MNPEKIFENAVVVSRPDEIVLFADVLKVRDEIMAKMDAAPKLINGKADADAVSFAARDGQTFIRTLQDLEAAQREPLNAALKAMRSLLNELISPVIPKAQALNNLAGEFAAQEERRVAAAEAARQAEIARLQKEQEDAVKLANEELAKASDLPFEQQLAVVEHAEQLVQSAAEATRARIVAPLPAPVKVAGTTSRKELCYSITDRMKAFTAYPFMFNLPEEKVSVLKDFCIPKEPADATETNKDSTSFQGITAWWETKTSTRKY